MHSNILHFIKIIVLVFIAQYAVAQSDTISHVDVVTLKDGSIFRGKIQSLKTDGDLVMRTLSNVVLTFPYAQVLKVEQQIRDDKAPEMVQYAVSEPVFMIDNYYNRNRTSKGFKYPRDGANIAILPIASSVGLGVGLNLSYIHSFNQFFGLGVGSGVFILNDEFIVSNTFTHFGYPVFAEIKGSLSKGVMAPYYNFKTGVLLGKAFEDLDGRFYFSPGFGFKIQQAKRPSFMIYGSFYFMDGFDFDSDGGLAINFALEF